MNSNYFVYTGGDELVPREVVQLLVHQLVVDIPQDAFYERPNLEKVVLCEGLRTIGERSFKGCVMLESINIPSTVVEIDHWAFVDCTGLKKVELREGLETIRPFAFNSCSTLERIEVPSSVSHIDDHAFAYCRALKKLTQTIQNLWNLKIRA